MSSRRRTRPWQPSPGHTEERQVLDSASDAFVAVDIDGVIVDWNRAAEQTFGWSRDDVIGRPLAETIIPPRLREAHRAGMQRYLRTGQAHILNRKLDLPAMHRSGREFPAEVTIWRTSQGRNVRFNAFIRDVSVRTQLQTHLSMLQRITAMSNASTDLEQVVRTAMEEISDLTGWPVGHAYLIDETGDFAAPTYWWTTGSHAHIDFRDETQTRPFRLGEGLPGRVALTGETAYIPDLQVDGNYPRAEAARASGLRSSFGFPIVTGQRVVGVIEFAAPVIDEPDEDMVGLLRNIGLQLGRAFERVRAAEQLEEASDLKSRLLQMVSHDLQAPLMSIGGFVRLLHEDWEDLDDDERLATVARIGRQVGRVESLVQDLLVMSRLEAGRLRTDPSTVALDRMLDELLRDLGVDDVRCNLDGATTVHADGQHLERMLTNLLTNADKYGEPPIEVSAQRTNGMVEIRVRDHGAGIDPEFRDRLFERFSRATDDRRGTGLGLSIVAGLARLNDGEVRHEPAEPGASFVLRLPGAG